MSVGGVEVTFKGTNLREKVSRLSEPKPLD